MTTYRPSWDLATIPDDLLTAERNRRIRGKIDAPRARIEKPCIGCGKPLSARERRKPCPQCGARQPRSTSPASQPDIRPGA